MPVTQEYNINTGDAYEGMVYGLTRSHSYIATGTAQDAIIMGRAVKAGSGDRGYLLGTDAAADDEAVYAIAIRQINHEAGTRPSDGTMVALTDQEFGAMKEGEINMVAVTAVTRDQKLFISTATGQAYGSTAAGRFRASNVEAIRSAAAGEVFPVRIFSVA